MAGNTGVGPQWPSRERLKQKFDDHPWDSGAATVDEYEANSYDTILHGKRFTYTDRQSGQPLVGYYDAQTGRFVAADEHDQVIVTHFEPESDDYAERLLDSTYRT